MITTCVDVFVKEDCIQDFIKATEKNHRGSVSEPDNFRFDILQSNDNPCHFVLYEVYKTAEGVAAHKETAHYLEWRDTVADMMAKPRQGNKFTMLFPEA
ncbi:MAG: antibiotic biosynthesis monooxygenase [Lentisphaerales bacterium]|nr:antibiotic biosynthesis monooxygenase [Lentisphaerales bacterium]